MNIFNKSVPTVRFTLFAAALLAFLFLAPADAHALKSTHEMTPADLHESGFSMKVENQKDGMVQFTLTRDLSKAPLFASDSNLEVRRSATLQIFGKSGLRAKCDVEPNKQENTITYRFVIARDYVTDSHFTLAEIDDYKDHTQERLIGGGAFYGFRLALFAELPSSIAGDRMGVPTAPELEFTLVAKAANSANDAKLAAQLAKLPDNAYPKSGVPIGEFNAGAVNWSAEQNGLCLAMSVEEDAEWRIGGAAKVALWVCNPGEKDVKFQHCARRDIGLRVLMKGTDGRERAADIAQFDGYPVAFPVLLPAGHIFKAKEFSVVFLPLGGKAAGAEPHFTLAAGAYKFRSELDLPGLTGTGADGKQRTPAEGEWTGTLKSGEVDVKLLAAAAKPAQAKPAIEHATVEMEP